MSEAQTEKWPSENFIKDMTKMEKALRFYADEKNHMNQPEQGGVCRELTPVDLDKGQIARNVLSEIYEGSQPVGKDEK